MSFVPSLWLSWSWISGSRAVRTASQDVPFPAQISNSLTLHLTVATLPSTVLAQSMPSGIGPADRLAANDVNDLYNFFFTHLHPHYAILDPEIYTPAATLLRSPFLLVAGNFTAGSALESFAKRHAYSMHRCISAFREARKRYLSAVLASGEEQLGHFAGEWVQVNGGDPRIPPSWVGRSIRLPVYSH